MNGNTTQQSNSDFVHETVTATYGPGVTFCELDFPKAMSLHNRRRRWGNGNVVSTTTAGGLSNPSLFGIARFLNSDGDGWYGDAEFEIVPQIGSATRASATQSGKYMNGFWAISAAGTMYYVRGRNELWPRGVCDGRLRRHLQQPNVVRNGANRSAHSCGPHRRRPCVHLGDFFLSRDGELHIPYTYGYSFDGNPSAHGIHSAILPSAFARRLWMEPALGRLRVTSIMPITDTRFSDPLIADTNYHLRETVFHGLPRERSFNQ